jgi:Fe-S cluster assembly protein SufB
VSYLEGCTAPMREENQLHAAVVELIALDDAEIKYSTVQNWYPGDAEGKGGVYNFVTKRGDCRGRNAKISWTQVETGSAITWKYPSCILRGDNSRGEFYSIWARTPQAALFQKASPQAAATTPIAVLCQPIARH